MTTSLTVKTLSNVSLVVLSLTRLAGEKTNNGGLELKMLKKLNGDKLGLPISSTVLAKAIGLGATALCRYACSLGVERDFGSMDSIYIQILANVTILTMN